MSDPLKTKPQTLITMGSHSKVKKYLSQMNTTVDLFSHSSVTDLNIFKIHHYITKSNRRGKIHFSFILLTYALARKQVASGL